MLVALGADCSRYYWGAELPGKAGPPQIPQFYHLSLAKPFSGQDWVWYSQCAIDIPWQGWEFWEPTLIPMFRRVRARASVCV